jgi:hypothetical protein
VRCQRLLHILLVVLHGGKPIDVVALTFENLGLFNLPNSHPQRTVVVFVVVLKVAVRSRCLLDLFLILLLQ